METLESCAVSNATANYSAAATSFDSAQDSQARNAESDYSAQTKTIAVKEEPIEEDFVLETVTYAQDSNTSADLRKEAKTKEEDTEHARWFNSNEAESVARQVIAIKDTTNDFRIEQYLEDTLSQPLPIYFGDVMGRYVGEVNSIGIPHGKGKVTCEDGKVYDGDFIDGKKEGKGTFFYGEEECYIGEFKDDKKHGRGKYQWLGGPIVELKGNWENDVMIRGICRYRSGDVYEGEYHGTYVTGKMSFKSGNIYDGEWKENKMHGRGTMKFYLGIDPNGNKIYDIYKGDWYNDMMEGRGKMTFANGNKYNGQFKRDMMDGEGTFCVGRDKYKGRFKNGVKDGKGTYYFEEGDVYEGDFKNDKFDGEGKLLWHTGDKYEGSFKNFKFEGFGMMTYANNDKDKDEWKGVYEGSWKNDMKHGRGKMIYRAHKLYKEYCGDWSENKFDGKGKLTFKAGKVYEGEFKDGKMDGEGTIRYRKSGDVYKGRFRNNEMLEGCGSLDGPYYSRKDAKRARVKSNS